MMATRASLLLNLKNRSDAEAWSEFLKLYAPLLYRYARARGLSRNDAKEVCDQLSVATTPSGTVGVFRRCWFR